MLNKLSLYKNLLTRKLLVKDRSKSTYMTSVSPNKILPDYTNKFHSKFRHGYYKIPITVDSTYNVLNKY